MPVQPRTGEVIVFDGDDYARLRQVEQRVEQVTPPREGPARIGDTGPLHEAAAQHLELQTAARERAWVFKVKALRRGKWRKLLLEHPPREDSDEDKEFGFNTDAGGNTVALACVTAVTHAGEPVEVDEDLIDSLSDGDFSRLLAEIVTVNEGPGPDPKADLVSIVTLIYGETFESPAR